MADLITVEQVGHTLTIGLNRPEKQNAMTVDMFRELARAYTQLCDTPDLRCGLLHSTADIFTAGLDLVDWGPVLSADDDSASEPLVLDDQVDPFNWSSLGGQQGRIRSKPLIVAIHSKCFTAGIELSLAADFIVASSDAEFAQLEVQRGLFPFGGAIDRFTQRFGWGNAMRWLLTGDVFDVHEAYRMGLVQEIVERDKLFDSALALAEKIGRAAPLGIQATLANAHVSQAKGGIAAAEDLNRHLQTVSQSSDLQEGIAAMFDKRPPVFTGK